jgi:hypothetical protein
MEQRERIPVKKNNVNIIVILHMLSFFISFCISLDLVETIE